MKNRRGLPRKAKTRPWNEEGAWRVAARDMYLEEASHPLRIMEVDVKLMVSFRFFLVPGYSENTSHSFIYPYLPFQFLDVRAWPVLQIFLPPISLFLH